jgi:septal ring factor EnvC (AmiA/AmiB activator)
MAARLALAGKATTIPKKTDGIVESIRLLRVTRDGAVKARSAAMVQLSQLIITAPQPLREQLAVRRSIRGKAALCRKLRRALSDLDQPTQAAKLALRSLARRIEQLDAEIAELDEQLKAAGRSRGAAHNAAARHLNRSRRSTARHRGPEHRAPPRRGLRSRRSAAQARSPRPPAARPVTASTTAATATPTERCT